MYASTKKIIEEKLLPFTKESTCYSPFSLYHALLIVAQCANDSAVQELRRVMDIRDEELLDMQKCLSKDSTLAVVSNLFSKYIKDMNPQFAAELTNKFGFVPQKLESADQVNKWCAQQTKNRIQTIVNDINFDTLILSAVNFKAEWATQFYLEDTW